MQVLEGINHIQENFRVTLFSQILLNHEIFHAMPFMLPTWIIRKNIFSKIIEIAIFAKI